jgi:DNA-binding response OmpR family regulator
MTSGRRWHDTEIMAERILMIDDDNRLAGMVTDYLGGAGFRVTVAGTGREGEALLKRETFDAVILDLMLPDADGLDLCRRLRATSDVPILMLTARGEPMDKVVGLEIGADDYLAKPFEPRELQARLRAVLRRKGSGGTAPTEILRFGRLEIDKGARVVRVDGEERTITSYQFAILLALAERAGRVLSRDALMDVLKGEKLEAFDRSVDVHISRIRAAIEDDPKKPRRILTLRGTGYVFAKDQDR